MSIFSQPLATHPVIDQALSAGAVAAISVSGGKDSQACALATVRYLDQIGHTGPRVLIHADLGRIEWRDSLPACERLAAALGLELMVVRREKGDMVDRWLQRWQDNVARFAQLERVKLVLPWSTPSMRLCTSELKVAPITQHLTQRFPGMAIVNITGIRREESTTRAQAAVVQEDKKLTRVRLGTHGWTWNPLLDWTLSDVWHEIRSSGVAPHLAYEHFNMTRVSCSACVLSNKSDLLNAASNPEHHEVLRELIDLELDSTFGFQGSRWLADLMPQLLRPDQQARLPERKEAARLRIAAEARIPKQLVYVDGWPRELPSLAEAELLAEVRREVAAAVGIDVQYTTAESVMDRYAELLKPLPLAHLAAA